MKRSAAAEHDLVQLEAPEYNTGMLTKSLSMFLSTPLDEACIDPSLVLSGISRLHIDMSISRPSDRSSVTQISRITQRDVTETPGEGGTLDQHRWK
jgi:hypothetical protein